MDPLKLISDLTKTDDMKRAKLFRWFARQPAAIQLAAVDFMVRNYHQTKEDPSGLNQAQRYFLGFVRALSNMAAVERASAKKAVDHDLEPLGGITRIQTERVRAMKKKKQSPKRQRLVALWGLVRELHNDKKQPLSFRDIAAFLEKYRNLKISYAYIERIWKELEGQGVQ